MKLDPDAIAKDVAAIGEQSSFRRVEWKIVEIFSRHTGLSEGASLRVALLIRERLELRGRETFEEDFSRAVRSFFGLNTS